MSELKNQIEFLNPNNVFAAADITVSNRFKKLVSEKARRVARGVAKKAVLTSAVAFALVGSGCGNVGTVSGPVPSEIPQISSSLPSESPFPSEGQKFDYLYDSYGLLKIAVDKEGLPVSYVSHEGAITKFEKEEVLDARKKAIEGGEPEILRVIPLSDYEKDIKPVFSNQNSEIHPRTDKLPEDTLSIKELEEKGVSIIQSDKVYLHIRKGAFEKGGPFANLEREKEKITIALIDGPSVSSDFMQDEKYTSVINYLGESDRNVKAYKDSVVNTLEKNRNQLKDNPQTDASERKLIDLKSNLYVYKNYLSDREIAEEMAVGDGELVGKHIYIYDFERDSAGKQSSNKPVKKTTIFIAVGSSNLAFESLFFDSKGTFKIARIQRNFNYDYSPDLTDTYPDPVTLYKAEGGSLYKFYPTSPGWVLRHELGHRGNRLEGKNDNYLSKEWDADSKAEEGLIKAHEEWRDRGSNKDYFYIFSILPEKGGGYILTQNIQTKTATTSVKV